MAAVGEDLLVTGRSELTLHADCPLSGSFRARVRSSRSSRRSRSFRPAWWPRALDLIRRFHLEGRIIGAICAAPLLLLTPDWLPRPPHTAHGSVADELPDLVTGSETITEGTLITRAEPAPRSPSGSLWFAPYAAPNRPKPSANRFTRPPHDESLSPPCPPRTGRLLVEVPVPVPGKNQVLLKVSHCGICGSDLHAWLNHPWYESVLPEVTFGHELSGSVVSTGPDAGDWKEGDRAVMIALQASQDPNDRYCAEGLPQLSPRRRVQGLHLDGGMAEYVCVEQEFLLPIPDGLDLPSPHPSPNRSLVAEHCIGNRSSVGTG